MLMTGKSPSSTLERGRVDFIESIHVGLGVLPHYLNLKIIFQKIKYQQLMLIIFFNYFKKKWMKT